MSKLFSTVGKTVDEVLSVLNDENTESYAGPDRTAVVGGGFLTTVDQSSVSTATMGSLQDVQYRTAVDIPGSRVTQGERFFLIDQREWNSTQSAWQLLGKIDIVKELLDQSYAVDGLLKYHSYARFGLDVIVQINPTSFQAGGLIAALVPYDQVDIESIAAMTTYCHGKLNCNINNVVRMKVPYIYSRGCYNLRNSAYSIWMLVIRVWSQLQLGSGTSTLITVTTLARFVDLELHGLSPLVAQMMRNEFRLSSSSNIVNLANYEDARAKVSLALGQEEFSRDSSSTGGELLHHFSQWTSIPCLAFIFTFPGTVGPGTQIWSTTVDPFSCNLRASSTVHPTNLSSIAGMFCFWRGDIVFEFQVFCTKYHSGRLMFVYVPGDENTKISTLTAKQASSGLTAVFDINGVNSTLVFRCPFISDTPYRVNPTTHKSLWPYATGKLVCYVYNRLNAPASVSPSVSINVYKSAVDLELYAPVYGVSPTNTSVFAQGKEDEGGFSSVPEVEQHVVEDKEPQGPLHVTPFGAVKAMEDPQLARKTPGTFPELAPGKPRHTVDHMDLYKFMGRAHYLWGHKFTKTDMQYTFQIPLSPIKEGFVTGTLRWFLSLFQLYRGSLDITMTFAGKTNVDGIVYFVPEGVAIETEREEQTPLLTLNYKTSVGAIRFNTGQTTNVQFRIPFYTPLEHIATHSKNAMDSVLGAITTQITNYSAQDEYLQVTYYISFNEDSQFSVPRAVPVVSSFTDTSSKTVMNTYWLDDDELVEESSHSSFDEIEEAQCSKCKMDLGDIVSCSGEKAKHFGVYVGDGVVHVDPEGNATNWFMKRKATVKKSKNLDKWCFALSPRIDRTLICETANLMVGREVEYDIFVKNCETYARGIASGDYGTKEGEKWKTLLSAVGVAAMTTTMMAMRHELLDTSLTKLPQKVGEVTNEVRKILEDTSAGVREFKEKVSSILRKTWPGKTSIKIMKWTCRIVKMCVGVGLCYAHGWDSKTVTAVVTMFSMDFLDLVIDGIEIGRMIIDELTTPKAQGLSEINQVLSIAKNAKDVIKMLIEIFCKVIERITGEHGKKIQWAQDKKEEIMNVLERAEKWITTSDDHSEGIECLKLVRSIQSVIRGEESLKELAGELRAVGTHVLNKLGRLDKPNAPILVRAEPTVLYLYGNRGGGKSLASMAIAVKLCKELGISHVEGIYTKPIMSDFWDGYAGQPVVIMDDLGQSTSDEDWTNFCQLVSSCPLRLNMANLEKKGTQFNSPFIIASSNLSHPCPKTVYCTDAIARRLHIKVKVSPKEEFSTHAMLDVAKAKKAGAYCNLDCLDFQKISDLASTPVSVQDIVLEMLHTNVDKQTLMGDIIQYWAQSNPREVFDTMAEGKNSGKYLWLFEKIKTSKWYILGCVGAVLSVSVLGVFAYHMIKNHFRDQQHDQSAYSAAIKPLRVVRLEQSDAQSVVDISNVVHGNLVRVGVGPNEARIHWLYNGLGVYDTYILMPYHGIKDADVDDDLYIERAGTIYSTNMKMVQVLFLESREGDLVLINVPRLPKFRDIRNHFSTEENIRRAEGMPGTLCTLDHERFTLVTESDLKMVEAATYVCEDDKGVRTDISVGRSWKAKACTVAGMCGGALVTSNNKMQNAIVGIHVAGGAHAISRVITKEMIEEMLKTRAQCSRIWKTEFVEEKISVGSKTKYHKSPLYDFCPQEVIKCPTKLFYQGEIDVMQVMLAKYSSPIVSEPLGYATVVEAYTNRMVSFFSEPRQLTYDECINGIEGLDAIDLKTSAGFPYNTLGLRKSDLIINGKMTQRLQQDVEKMEEDLHMNRSIQVVFTTCAKDELRPLSKVMLGKTRAIEACPVSFTILFRRYLGYALAQIQSHPGFHTGIAVGVDPDQDWHCMWYSIVTQCDLVVGLDFSNYDASLSPFMIYHAGRVLGQICGLDPRLVDRIMEPIVNSVHQLGSMRYYVHGSMPSGTPATSVLNSIINVVNICHVLCALEKISVFEVFKLFKILTYGDDVLLCIKKEYLDQKSFPLSSFVQGLEELGLSPTGADKMEVKVTPVHKMSFLKRTFYVDEWSICHPRISEETVYSMLAWKSDNASMKDLIETSIWFMFHHGPRKYVRFCTWLRGVLCRVGIGLYIPTYKELEVRYDRLVKYRFIDDSF